MLNKNQSKKWNSWKYALVLPALGAFVLLFQIEVIAQEKMPIVNKNNTAEQVQRIDTDVYKIDRNTSDEELQEKSKNLKINYNITATFSGIRRNSNNELTSIIIKINKGKEIEQKWEVKGNNPINTIGIIVSKNENGELAVNLGSDETFSNETNIPVAPNAPAINSNEISAPPAPTPPKSPTIKSEVSKVDDVKKVDKGWEINFGTFSPEDNIKIIQNNKNVDYKKAVIIINGEISDYQTLEKLKPNEIDNMSVEKISTNLEARKIAMIKKYGEKAIDGIIEIETKEF